MKFRFFLFLFILLFINASPLYAQIDERNTLWHEADEMRFLDPQKSLKLYDYLEKGSTGKEALAIEIKTLGIHSALGNYGEAIEISQHIKELLSQYSDPSLEFEYTVEMSSLYFELDFYSEGIRLQKKAREILKPLSPALQKRLQMELQLSNAIYNQNENLSSRIKELQDILKRLPGNDVRKLWLNYQIGAAYYPIQVDSSKVYFEKILHKNSKSSLEKAALLYFQMMDGNTEKDNVLEFTSSDVAFDRNLQLLLLEKRKDFYLQKYNVDSLAKYQNKYKSLENLLQLKKRNAKVMLIQGIYHQKRLEAEQQMASNKKLTWTGIAILSLILFAYGFYKVFPHKKNEESVAEENSKTIIIPDKTELEILEKLKNFENSDLFLDKQLRLATLAKLLNTNTRYLSTIINSSKNKSFNSYINYLRIQYVLEKLNSDSKYLSFKISYLAKESGFASQSSFTTAFKEVTGMTPSAYLKSLQRD